MGKYAAKTVNERLFAAGTLDEFDDAVNRRDRPKLIELLVNVELSPKQANETIDALFINPKFYGFSD